MQTATKRKEPKMAGRWGLIAGPFGFYYIGWRYAVAGTAVFGGVFALAVLLLDAPLWLILVNLPVLAWVGRTTCLRLNHLIQSGKHRNVKSAQTMPVAFFSMTRGLPPAAAASGGAMGITTALLQLMGGHFGNALFILALVTPVVVVASFIIGALLAAALDHWVMRVAPDAARHVVPPLIKLGN